MTETDVRRMWYLLVVYIAVILVCYRVALQCRDHKTCTLQVMGHIYPATFMLGLGWSSHKPAWRYTECVGMVVFWLFYWIIDAVQQSGVDLDNLKTVQHYMFTMLVGVCGIFRHARGPKRDTFVMVLLVIAFALFVFKHPQPNAVGNAMHAATAVWLGCFIVAYVAKAERETFAFMVLAATTFMSSQLGLTTAAAERMDTVAYFAIVTVASLGVDCLLVF